MVPPRMTTLPASAQDATLTGMMQADLSALLFTASYALTGLPSVVTKEGRQHLPALSPAFDALLRKGLHTDVRQRFQHPSELRQALQALVAQPMRQEPPPPPAMVISAVEQQALPGIPTEEPVIHVRTALPLDTMNTPSAAFPQVPANHDTLAAAGWVVGTLLAEVAVLLLAR